MKKVFLPDSNGGEIVDQIDITVKIVDDKGNDVSNETYKNFYRIWDIETLNNLLETQIITENYEASKLIKEVIDEKNIQYESKINE
jgi:hypothetical protein